MPRLYGAGPRSSSQRVSAYFNPDFTRITNKFLNLKYSQALGFCKLLDKRARLDGKFNITRHSLLCGILPGGISGGGRLIGCKMPAH